MQNLTDDLFASIVAMLVMATWKLAGWASARMKRWEDDHGAGEF